MPIVRTRPRRSIALRAALAPVLLATALGFAAPPAADASSVAYIDGDEVWVSTLDGSRKERLSTGEGDYRELTAADNGRILAVQTEAGKISQLSRIRLWESNGQLISQGPLPSQTGWTSYVAPLGLDLTSDGVFAVYGYLGQTGLYPNASLSDGHYAILSDTKVGLEPIGQSGYKYPTAFGRRVVAAQSTQPVAQIADSSNPFATTWGPLDIDIATVPGSPELRRTDVAATGTLAAVEMRFGAGDDKIGAFSLSGMDFPITARQTTDCFLPTVGEASEVSLSQDGRYVAWKDAEGVKVAGAPSGTAELCTLASPPVVISATGKEPSIGGADLAQLRPVASTPAPAPGPAAAAPPAASGSLAVTIPSKVTVAALAGASGVPLKIRVPGAGRVTVTATVPPGRLGLQGRKAIVIGTGSATAKKAGTVTVKLRLSKKARKYRRRLKGLTLTLRIKQGTATTIRTVRLR